MMYSLTFTNIQNDFKWILSRNEMGKFVLRITGVFVSLVLLGCTAEEGVVSQSNDIQVRKLRLDDLKRIPAAYKAMQRKLPSDASTVKEGLTRRLVYDAERDYYLDTDKILEVSKDGYSAITIPVYRMEKPPYDENLYLVKNPDSKYTTFLIRYNLTETDRKNYLAGGEIEGLPGKTLILDLNQNQPDCVPEIYSHCYYNVTVQWQANQPGPGGDVHGGTAGVQTPVYIYTLDHCDYTILQCYESLMDSYPFIGGNTGGGGGGGSGSGGNPAPPGSELEPGHPLLVPIISLPQSDPCEGLAAMGDPNQVNIKPEYDNFLKPKVDSPNNFGERGVNIKAPYDSDGNRVYATEREDQPGGFQVDGAAGAYYFAGIHTHPQDGRPMFSFGDVRVLYEMYRKARSENKSLVTEMLVIKDASGDVSIYALKVDDELTLANAINIELNKHTGADNDAKEAAAMIAQNLAYNSCGGNYTAQFLNDFKYYGISLYEAMDESFTNWSKLSLESPSSQQIISTPCN